MEEKEVSMLELQKKQLKWMRLQTAILVGMLALFAALGLFLAGQVMTVVQQVQALDLNTVNDTVVALQDAALELQNVDMDVLNDAVASLKGAAENLTEVDMEAINDGIRGLATAAEGLEDLDISQLNDLIGSLNTVAERMEKTSSVLSKIFK